MTERENFPFQMQFIVQLAVSLAFYTLKVNNEEQGEKTM